jgi:hypothetical protein
MNRDRAATTARILETMENYARVEVKESARPKFAGHRNLGSDEQFWFLALNGDLPFGASIDFPQGAVISEWVPRVPGLFWTPAAAMRRKYRDEDVERFEGRHVVLRPFGKSRVVSGGIGTLRLPPSTSGDRLVTLATSGNVSGGIPALISDDVWQSRRLGEGHAIEFRGATWQAMDESWASRFPSTRGIPRGYLRITTPQAVDPMGQAATEIHPFSIMEYASGDVELFDFVFYTAITAVKNYRRDTEKFFDDYKNEKDRQGRYLIAADVAEPMWDSDFTSPNELKRNANYQLLLRRIEDSMAGNDTMEHLHRVLCKTDRDLLKRFGADIGIPQALWFRDGSLSDESANQLARVTSDKVPLLIDAIEAVNPAYLEI